jgi:uncharacterized protein YecE (DUF72 family)
VVQEIISNQLKYGERVGITASRFKQFEALNEQHAQILVQLPLVVKANEVLRESLGHVDNLRHRLAVAFADSAEAHARAEGGDSTLLTAYERTIAYRSVIADKAVKTRKKKGEAKKAQEAAAEATEEKEAADAARPAAKAEKDEKAAEGISRIPNAPPDDIFTITLEPLKEFLVDLPPGALRGMRREQEGWEGVFHEITSNQAVLGERAGITATNFARFVALDSQYDQILAQLPLVEKANEVLTESLAHVDNLRHRLAATFADAAEAQARAEGGDPTVLTAYEKTIAYRGVVAGKAAKTRQKNKEGKL